MQCFKGGKNDYLKQISFISGDLKASPSTLSGCEEDSAPGRGVFLDFDG